MVMKQPTFDLIFGSSASIGEMIDSWPELDYLRGWGYLDKGRPPKLDKKIEEDLIAENQRLRMENEYLKKLKNVSDLKSQYLFNSLNIRKNNTSYVNGDIVLSPNLPKSLVLACTVGGDTAVSEPDFREAVLGATYTDGSVTWEVIPRAYKLKTATESEIQNLITKELA